MLINRSNYSPEDGARAARVLSQKQYTCIACNKTSIYDCLTPRHYIGRSEIVQVVYTYDNGLLCARYHHLINCPPSPHTPPTEQPAYWMHPLDCNHYPSTINTSGTSK